MMRMVINKNWHTFFTSLKLHRCVRNLILYACAASYVTLIINGTHTGGWSLRYAWMWPPLQNCCRSVCSWRLFGRSINNNHIWLCPQLITSFMCNEWKEMFQGDIGNIITTLDYTINICSSINAVTKYMNFWSSVVEVEVNWILCKRCVSKNWGLKKKKAPTKVNPSTAPINSSSILPSLRSTKQTRNVSL